MPFAGEAQRRKVPVTLITGFLGAGKTSLLNYLLGARAPGRNISVIENEYGEINVDKLLVQDNLLEKEDLVSLENGCACCSLRRDVVKAFVEIERRARQRSKTVDSVLMETTGLADPAPVAFTFFANPWIASRFKLDSIMCVVDARYLLQHLDDERPEGVINEAVQQLAFSDLILLNKVDLVSEEQKAEVLRNIKRINTTAKIIECQLNDPAKRPPMDQLLGINSFSINRAMEIDPDFLASDSDDELSHLTGPDDGVGEVGTTDPQQRGASLATSSAAAAAASTAAAASAAVAAPAAAEAAAAATAPAPAAAEAAAAAPGPDDQPSSSGAVGPCSCASKRRASDRGETALMEACSSPAGHSEALRQPKRRRKKLHDLSNVTSIGITARGALDEYRFNAFMRDFLAEKANDIFRCKGVLSIHGYGNQKFVFQGVHETICYGPAHTPWEESEEDRVSQMVFIGKHLEREALTEGFRSCVWMPLPEGWEEVKDPSSKRTYYFCKKTGEKSWERPRDQCAYVVAKQKSAQQPPGIAPRVGRRPSFIVPNVQGSAAAAGAAAARAEAQPQPQQVTTSA